MSNIEELQSRITAAMERIGAGAQVLADRAVEAEANAGPDPVMIAALDEEKLANAQLEERLRALRATQEEETAAMTEAHSDAVAAMEQAYSEALATQRAELDQTDTVAQLRADLEKQSDAMARLDMDLQRLRQSNDQLRDSNAALRGANEAGVGDAHLINKAMLAEIEGLRAVRVADLAEARAVLTKLDPLLAAAQTVEDA